MARESINHTKIFLGYSQKYEVVVFGKKKEIDYKIAQINVNMIIKLDII